MRFAILGAGRIGIAHVSTLMAQTGVSELLVADLDPARARTAAESVGAASHGTIDDAFSFRPDGIVIAAPTPAHAELILRAVRAGIPTFCEKPLAESLASSVAVVEEVERHDVPVQIGFQRRFDAGYRAAKQALEAGDIGELRRLHLLTCDPTPPPAEYIPQSGGIYRDCHIHDFDILRWVTGREVVSVFATGTNRGAAFFGEAGDVDESAALLTLDDGTLATLQGSRYNGAGYDVRMELAGTLGNRSVGLDDRVPLTSAEPGVGFPAGTPWPNFQERFAAAYSAELAAFVSVAAGERPSPCTPREALEALYIAEAATLSRAEGRSVRLDEVRG
ncbi:Gfo/Idh/MocA family protein [Lacisediminihabitans profunda]|uniref:Dehydrogenase n=1 Tax=Lacisediminihabitans profunda TaxID=2594790 RepID=A0A5C8UUB7_9MICO|nr:Gfo/Idh/MocA family oxidoreductase [Lacisediminihabitans profunda]TXN31178.1 dehydrogenase [Lacisediminihabitans profunda]